MMTVKRGTGTYDNLKTKRESISRRLSDVNKELSGNKKELVDYIFEVIRERLTVKQYESIINTAKVRLANKS